MSFIFSPQMQCKLNKKAGKQMPTNKIKHTQKIIKKDSFFSIFDNFLYLKSDDKHSAPLKRKLFLPCPK